LAASVLFLYVFSALARRVLDFSTSVFLRYRLCLYIAAELGGTQNLADPVKLADYRVLIVAELYRKNTPSVCLSPDQARRLAGDFHECVTDAGDHSPALTQSLAHH